MRRRFVAGVAMVTLLPLPEMIGEFAPVVTAVPGADGASKPSSYLRDSKKLCECNLV